MMRTIKSSRHTFSVLSAVRHERSNMHHYHTNESAMIKRGMAYGTMGTITMGVKVGVA